MKIVVLAGGTSTERSVSITSGTMVCKALREKNHQAVLVDVFCGIDVKGNLEDVFAEEAYDIDKAAEYMHSFDEKLDGMIASRRRFFGRNVLELGLVCNDVPIDICINEKDLFGVPEVGRRFKGQIWLQGLLEHL